MTWLARTALTAEAFCAWGPSAARAAVKASFLEKATVKRRASWQHSGYVRGRKDGYSLGGLESWEEIGHLECASQAGETGLGGSLADGSRRYKDLVDNVNNELKHVLVNVVYAMRQRYILVGGRTLDIDIFSCSQDADIIVVAVVPLSDNGLASATLEIDKRRIDEETAEDGVARFARKVGRVVIA